jgi:hypothetical protein
MHLNVKYFGIVFVLFSLFISQNVIADEKYELVDSSEFSFNFSTKEGMYNGIVSQFENPDTKETKMYIKITDTILTSLTCNGKKIELKNSKVEDGFVDTLKYGKIKIGLYGPPPHRAIVWVTPNQKKAFRRLFPPQKMKKQ